MSSKVGDGDKLIQVMDSLFSLYLERDVSSRSYGTRSHMYHMLKGEAKAYHYSYLILRISLTSLGVIDHLYEPGRTD